MTNLVRRRSVRSSLVLLLTGFAVTLSGSHAAMAVAPTVIAFLPVSGPIGTSVVIAGAGFDDASEATAVTFNGAAATFTVNSNVQITATVPAAATDGPIAVTDSEGTATSVLSFDVTPSPMPTIIGFLPLSGPTGTSVVITGTGFTGATAVTFNGTSATFTVNSDTQITATVPTAATDGPIAVTTPGGTATSAIPFDVTPSPMPTIIAFLPVSGPIGTSVEITGTGFTGTTAVKFNGTSASFTVNSNTQITATVPVGATTGPIAVTTPGGTATSANSFTVTGGDQTHGRTVTLELRRHLVARGRVTADDGFDACESGVTVKVQRRQRGGGWRTVGTDETNTNGAFREGIHDRAGIYRVLAVREALGGGGVCLTDRSPRVRHRH